MSDQTIDRSKLPIRRPAARGARMTAVHRTAALLRPPLSPG